MEDEQYIAISGYLQQGTYPAGFRHKITEICIKKKLQKFQAGKGRAVLNKRLQNDGHNCEVFCLKVHTRAAVASG